MSNDFDLRNILRQAASSTRLTREECLELARMSTPDQVMSLGRAALDNRRARHGLEATYVHNLQVNPSNICAGQCKFCGFGVPPEADSAYVLSEAEILARLEEWQPREMHLVGGLNADWHFTRYLNLLQQVRERFPGIFIKAFTAVEVDWFARQQEMSVSETLLALKDAGLESLTGGGAELFSPRIRAMLCPDKLSPDGWLRVHAQAHAAGLGSNATMLYGCGENAREQVEHLLAIRELQDETSGFIAFIPLAYQDKNTGVRPAPLVSLKVIALARLVLDNVEHIKAYWPMLGLACTAAGLSWGADDIDGTLGRERIAHAAGAQTPMQQSHLQMQAIIRSGNMIPIERDGRYNRVEQA